MDRLNNAAGLKFTSRATYQILVKGFLDESWSERLNGMMVVNMSSDSGVPVTKIYGLVSDQAELLGVLNNIYEMHLPLISLDLGTGPAESDQSED